MRLLSSIFLVALCVSSAVYSDEALEDLCAVTNKQTEERIVEIFQLEPFREMSQKMGEKVKSKHLDYLKKIEASNSVYSQSLYAEAKVMDDLFLNDKKYNGKLFSRKKVETALPGAYDQFYKEKFEKAEKAILSGKPHKQLDGLFAPIITYVTQSIPEIEASVDIFNFEISSTLSSKEFNERYKKHSGKSITQDNSEIKKVRLSLVNDNKTGKIRYKTSYIDAKGVETNQYGFSLLAREFGLPWCQKSSTKADQAESKVVNSDRENTFSKEKPSSGSTENRSGETKKSTSGQ